MKKCPRCATELPVAARFCWNCGAAQPVEPERASGIDWAAELLPQFNASFLQELRQRVEEDLGSGQWPAYQERLYESGFRDVAHRRLSQLADMLQQDRVGLGWSATRAQRKLEETVWEMVEYFIVYHAANLNPVVLSENILRYQGAVVGAGNIYGLALDYLNFAEEKEVVYTDLLRMPVDKLRNAGRSYLFPAKDERILLVCDQSLLGSGKEGFALTERALYWKAQFQPARQASFHELRTLKREKDWLLVNDLFFNANPSLNVKMLLLLKRLRLSFS